MLTRDWQFWLTAEKHILFLQFLAPDITAICICEIHCLALGGFDLNTVHKISSEEKKSRRSWDLSPGLLGGKEECFHCAIWSHPRGAHSSSPGPYDKLNPWVPFKEAIYSPHSWGKEEKEKSWVDSNPSPLLLNILLSSTSLPLASTSRWIRLTLSTLCPLF